MTPEEQIENLKQEVQELEAKVDRLGRTIDRLEGEARWGRILDELGIEDWERYEGAVEIFNETGCEP